MDPSEQQEFFELQFYKEQVEKISGHLDQVSEQLANLQISKNALAQLQETSLGTEILAQVANGIFVKTQLKDNQKVTINVGSTIVVEKTIPQAIEMLKVHETNLSEQQTQLQELLDRFSQKTMAAISSLEEKHNKVARNTEGSQ